MPLSLWPLACVLLVLPLPPLVGERRRPSRPRCPCRAPSPVSSGLTHNRPLSLGRQMARSVTSEVQPHRAGKGDQCVCVCALQVRVAGAKGNKAQTLYTTDSYVVSLAAR